MSSIEADFQTDLEQIKAESIVWIPLEEGAYLHKRSDDPVIQVVGLPTPELSDSNILWLL